MDGFSVADGFVDITECLADTIKYVANEPLVGHFYIQEHLQNGTPNLVCLKDNVAAKVHDTTLHTEDVEDSISTVKSIKGCGVPIVDEMIKDVNRSLVIISTKQVERGLNLSPRKKDTWGHRAYALHDGEGTTSYLSSIFMSAKQKASNIKWTQRNIRETAQKMGVVSVPSAPLAIQSASTSSSVLDIDTDELPLSSAITDEIAVGDHISLSEIYDDFKADRLN